MQKYVSPYQLMLAAVMLLAAVIAYALTPRIYTADSNNIDLSAMVPARFADWQQVEMKGVIVNPEVDDQLAKVYAQVLERVYVNTQGQRIMLSIAYSRDQRQSSGQQTHLPDLCYPAQGFALHDKHQMTLQLGSQTLAVNSMIAQRDQRVEPLMYWITTNGVVSTERNSRKLNQVQAGLKGLIYDGMIIRVSTINEDTNAARLLEADFLSKLSQSQTPANRAQIFGKGMVVQ
ncbi:exosortase-associated protein EpsI, B-type [Aquitalea pelogenes]|uniref:exosortase-associated protein EpsI, B-type n=1 Tax=Aquitalea pelogenes TaxID=1293573 RepID=UPI0009E715FB|nr:exosortase-associated protein EpsI, B-type [Aquitalea pelogenes]